METVIQIKTLSVYYGSICALEDVNMDVARGEFLAIIGPNGGGKSTLLKAILGLIKPSKGSITVAGQAPIGYVSQFSRFDRDFPISVQDAVLMGRLTSKSGFFHKYTSEDRALVSELVEKMEIKHLKDKQIGQLSGGELQRVLIARALAVKPDILLLDEPTESVDANLKGHIYDILKKLNEEITIILVTHDIGVVSAYVKNIACLNKRLYYHGGAELDEEIIQKVYGCPVDLISHGMPHRVLKEHKDAEEKDA